MNTRMTRLDAGKDHFEGLNDSDKELIMRIVANFHVRNGADNYDGSMGEIVITPGQFNRALAIYKKLLSGELDESIL